MRPPDATPPRLLALATGVGAAFAAGLLLVPRSSEELRAWIDGTGAAGAVVFVVAAALLTCALFPFPVLAAASGLLFGTVAGTAASVAGATIGAVAAFGVARAWGAGPVAGLAGPRLRALLAWVGRRGFVAVLYVRILPGVPRGAANYLLGLTPVGLGAYTAATAIGTAPRAFAYTALGSSFAVGRLDSPEAVAAVALLVGLAVLGAVLTVVERRREGGGTAAGGAGSHPGE